MRGEKAFPCDRRMQTADRWEIPISDDFPFQDLGDCIPALCSKCGRKIVLMIDEVD